MNALFEGDLDRFATKLAEPLNPRLVAINGSKKGTTFPLTADQITIGRESASAVSLNHASVSRRHCVIEREGDNFKIRDLGSSNGTFVNGQPVNDKMLNHADQVRIGSIALLFLTEETEDTTSGHLVRFDDSQPINESAKQLRPESLLHQTEVVVDLSEHERLTRDLGVLVKIGTRISRLRHTQELVREILDSIFDVVPVDRGAILLSQAEKEFSLIHGKHRRDQATEVRVSRTVVEHVLREGIAILTNDIATSENLSTAESLVAAQISSLICVPLIVFDKTLGVIYLDTSDPIIRFDEAHLQLVAAIAGMAAVSIENARQLEWLEGENSRLRSTLAIEHNMIGERPAMAQVYQFIQSCANTIDGINFWRERHG